MWSFRWRKDSVKTAKSATNGGGAGGIGGGRSGATTLPKAAGTGGGGGGGGGGDASDPLAALFGKTSSAMDEQLVRERLQALGLDFFRDDFEGVTVAKTKCLTCETCTEQKETMIDIAIPIASSEVSDAAKNPQLFYQVRSLNPPKQFTIFNTFPLLLLLLELVHNAGVLSRGQ